MLGELESEEGVVIGDLEAGLGTMLRLRGQRRDAVLVVTEPSGKAIEVARRAAATAAERGPVTVVANRIRDDADLEVIRETLGGYEIVVVPEDAAITQAEYDGVAPIDVAADSPAVRAIAGLADRLF